MCKKLIYVVPALVLFGLLYGVTHIRREPVQQQAVQILAFGDSVLGLARDETGITAMLGEALGKSVYNAGLGGTCIARLDRGNRLDNGMDSLSLTALAKATKMGDFGPQQTVYKKESIAEYFGTTIDGLETIDIKAVEIVLIEHGLNDFYAGVPLRNEEDPMDEYTFAGALRSSIEALQKANPDARILLVTPTYTWMLGEYTCEEFDAGYGNQQAYVDEEIKIAAEYGIEIIDVYHDFFPHEQPEDWKLYTADGLHPNEEGRKKIVEKILEYLNGGER